MCFKNIKICLASLMVAGAVVAQDVPSGEGFTRLVNLRCELPVDLLDDLNFRYYGQGEKNKIASRVDRIELLLAQKVATGEAGVSPDLKVYLYLKDSKGELVHGEYTQGNRALRRVVAAPTRNGIVVSYAESKSTPSFVVVANRNGSGEILIHERTTDGNNQPIPTYKEPTPIACRMGFDVESPEPVDLSKLKPKDQLATIDNYLRKPVWNRQGAYQGALGLDEAEAEALQERLEKTLISKSKEGSECGRLAVRSQWEASDHTGQILGYKVGFYCSKLRELRQTNPNSNTHRLIRPTLSIYVDAESNSIAGTFENPVFSKIDEGYIWVPKKK